MTRFFCRCNLLEQRSVSPFNNRKSINPECAPWEFSVTLFEFEHQVKQHKDRVYGSAFHYLGTAEEAEDVTQEVFIRFWQHRTSIDEKQPIGWLLRVTRNAAIDAIRKRKTYQRNVSVDSEMIEQPVKPHFLQSKMQNILTLEDTWSER